METTRLETISVSFFITKLTGSLGGRKTGRSGDISGSTHVAWKSATSLKRRSLVMGAADGPSTLASSWYSVYGRSYQLETSTARLPVTRVVVTRASGAGAGAGAGDASSAMAAGNLTQPLTGAWTNRADP